ncbi:MAG: tetratricopeptide repeat protein [Gammaproteobacteria bacterium]|nr:tetratricopeptide repeat protein [Gammaproteobacteria bacterium]
MNKYYLIIALILTLGGCSVTGPMQQPADIEIKNSGPTQVLLAQAVGKEKQGNISEAIALTERAVRIEPRNAFAWHRLARLYFSSGNLKKAEQFTRRSNQLARGHQKLMQDNQQLLEEIHISRQGF